MKILVTGSSGFIGNAICKTLSECGYEVSNLDRSRFQLDPSSANNVLENCNVVIHCAGIAHTKLTKNIKMIREVYNANVEFTKKLYKKSMIAGVQHFIFLSSSKVYGAFSRKGIVFNELDNLEPEDVYARSKLLAETAIISIPQKKKIKYTILRLPLTYSERNKANMNKLEKLVNVGLPLPFAEIGNKRSLINLNNLTEFIRLICLNSKSYNQIFNVCDDRSISTPELVKLLANTSRKRLILFRLNNKLFLWLSKIIGMQAEYNALWNSFEIDNTKSKKVLNWRPRYSLFDVFKKVQ